MSVSLYSVMDVHIKRLVCKEHKLYHGEERNERTEHYCL